MAQNSNNSKRTQTIILAILAVAVVALLIYIFSNKSYYNQLLDEKEIQRTELQSQLDSLMNEHAKVKDEYGALSDSLKLKDSIILANADEIKGLLNTKYEYTLVKKKLDRLRKVSQGYLRQMDSLYTVNRQLSMENEQMKKEVAKEKTRSTQLQKDNAQAQEQISKAAVLKAYGTSATPIRSKGAGKEEATNKKNRVEKIKISFTLGENNLIPEGNKDIFIRISDPTGTIIAKSTSDEYSFRFAGQILQYSLKETVSYNGSSKQVNSYWNTNSDKLKSGSYEVTIYADGNVIGNTFFKID